MIILMRTLESIQRRLSTSSEIRQKKILPNSLLFITFTQMKIYITCINLFCMPRNIPCFYARCAPKCFNFFMNLNVEHIPVLDQILEYISVYPLTLNIPVIFRGRNQDWQYVIMEKYAKNALFSGQIFLLMEKTEGRKLTYSYFSKTESHSPEAMFCFYYKNVWWCARKY